MNFNETGRPSGSSQDAPQGTYYQILGVPANAELSVIQAAFRDLARQYHPDVFGNRDNKAVEQRFKEISEAYTELSDSTKRRLYDDKLRIEAQMRAEQMRRASGQSGDPSTDLWSIFDNFFGQGSYSQTEVNQGAQFRSRAATFAMLAKQASDRGDRIGFELYERARRNSEAQAEIFEAATGGSFGRRAQADQFQQAQRPQQDTRQNRASEGPSHRLRFDRGPFAVYMVNERGQHISEGYRDIQLRGTFLVGITLSGSEVLLNPSTGKEITRDYYQAILIQDGLVLGRNKITGEVVMLDPNDGREISERYAAITRVGGALVGKTLISKASYLLAPNGKVLSGEGFDDIVAFEGYLVGKRYSWKVILDGNTGKPISDAYARIISRKGKLFGIRFSGGLEEEIILKRA